MDTAAHACIVTSTQSSPDGLEHRRCCAKHTRTQTPLGCGGGKLPTHTNTHTHNRKRHRLRAWGRIYLYVGVELKTTQWQLCSVFLDQRTQISGRWCWRLQQGRERGKKTNKDTSSHSGGGMDFGWADGCDICWMKMDDGWMDGSNKKHCMFSWGMTALQLINDLFLFLCWRLQTQGSINPVFKKICGICWSYIMTSCSTIRKWEKKKKKGIKGWPNGEGLKQKKKKKLNVLNFFSFFMSWPCDLRSPNC